MKKGLIPISAAQALSEKYKAPIVVVFAIHPDKENFTITTYGETKKLCRVAAGYSEQITKAVYDAAFLLQAKEPVHLPEEPAIWNAVRPSKSMQEVIEQLRRTVPVLRQHASNHPAAVERMDLMAQVHGIETALAALKEQPHDPA